MEVVSLPRLRATSGLVLGFAMLPYRGASNATSYPWHDRCWGASQPRDRLLAPAEQAVELSSRGQWLCRKKLEREVYAPCMTWGENGALRA